MKVGIVGGIAPESTVDYYISIIKEYQRRMHDDNYPQIVIDSLDKKEMLTYVSARSWSSLVKLLVRSINSLAAAGADFAVIASNTPHIVFDKVKANVNLPLVSIIDVTCARAKHQGHKKLGLLGTAFTMRENFYLETFEKQGMEIVLPNIDEQQYIHKKLFSEIELGIIKNETKHALLSIIDRMYEEDGIDGVILGCTELPLILKDGDREIPFLNTVQIHVEAIVDMLTSN